jgi:hypothetical protein
MPEPPDEATLAEMIAEAVQMAVGPLVTRLATAERDATAAKTLVDSWRDRVVVLEAKAHPPIDHTALYERVAVLETKAPIAGPPGPAGKDGVDGKDGASGMRWKGVWGKQITSAEAGDFVTHDGALWLCHESTTARPGSAPRAWTLTVKRAPERED